MINLKLETLISNLSFIEKEIIKWKGVLKEVNVMEREMEILQKRFVKLGDDELQQNKIQDLIQRMEEQ